MIGDKEILAALSHVDDPDLKKDIVSLGMVQKLEVTDHLIKFDLVLTTPACPMKDMLVSACKNAIQYIAKSSAEIEIFVTSQVSTQRENANVLAGVKNIIAVASGKGGVGKSTVSAGLAIALSQKGATVGLLDADIYGPSIPTLFQLTEPMEMVMEKGQQWMIPAEKEGIKLVSIGMLTQPNQAIVWRGPMISSAFKQFINETKWGNLDYLIIDLPPGTGDVQITLSQLVPLTGVVVVTTPQEMSMADARRAIQMFQIPAIAKPILGIVENMSYFVPEDAPEKKYAIFGTGGGKKLASETSIPFLGELPLTSSIREKADTGKLFEADQNWPPFQNLASEIARQISIVNSTGLT